MGLWRNWPLVYINYNSMESSSSTAVKWKMQMSCGLTIPQPALLSRDPPPCPRTRDLEKDAHCSVVIIVKNWMQDKCPPMKEWISKMWHNYVRTFLQQLKVRSYICFNSEVSETEWSNKASCVIMCTVDTIFVILKNLQKTISPQINI